MAQALNRIAAGSKTLPIIAADIGGTFARLGIVQRSGAANPALAVNHYRTYRCADYPSFTAIMRDYLRGIGDQPVAHIAIASAGYPLGDTLIQTNVSWKVSLADLGAELGLHEASLINDFAAVAYAVRDLPASETTLVSECDAPAAPGPIVIIGPGTGLGASVLIHRNGASTVLTTEAGAVTLAPITDLEVQIFTVLRRQLARVPLEAALSGPGLVNLYNALCTLRSSTPLFSTPEAVSEAALRGSDATARQALEVFCGLMGSVAGDLALCYGAHGGVYLAGGVLPRIREFLLSSSFMERFTDKGPLRTLMERIPVRLIEHGQLGVIGAASWYLENHPGA